MIKKTNAKLKMVESKNLHLTLKFLGDIDERIIGNLVEDMKKVAKNTDPFKAQLRGLGVFPNENYVKIIWIGFHDNGETSSISKALNEHLAYHGFRKEKNYKSHITIARMKTRENKEKIIQIVNDNKERVFKSVVCNEMKLKKSILTPQGPIYTDIEVVAL